MKNKLKYIVGMLGLMLFFSAGEISAQSEKNIVTGRITSEATGEPVSGASILIKGTNISVYSDSLGNYTLNMPDYKRVLNVSAPGFRNKEIALKGKPEMDISLYESVFNDYYGQTRNAMNIPLDKIFNGTGIDNVEDFLPTTVISPDELLQNQSKGARAIIRSGNIATGANVFVRGFNSLNTNAQPLYVVDGIPWNNRLGNDAIIAGFTSNPLLMLNVQDIESITVLKDATSIYGSQGGNGLILITTKRGKERATRIQLDMQWGIIDRPKTIPVMNANQHKTYLTDVYKNYGSTTSASINPGKELDNWELFDEDPTKLNYKKYHNNTNWADQVFRTGFTQSYNLGVTGGDDIALYSLSVGYTGAKGVLKDTDLDRFNTKFNAAIKISPKVNLIADFMYTYLTQNSKDDGVSTYSPSYISYIKSPLFTYHTYSLQGNPTSALEDVDALDISNPNALVENQIAKNTHYMFGAGLHFNWEISDKFSFHDDFSYQFEKETGNYFRPMQSVTTEYLPEAGIYAYNTVRNYFDKSNTLFNNSYISYSLNAGQNFLDIAGGFRIKQIENRLERAEGHNTGDDKIHTLTSNLAGRKVGGINETWRSMAFYSNINYDYQKKYFLNLSASVDGSSRFGKKAENAIHMFGGSWGFFPGVNASWLISSEEFMQNADIVNLLKLRVGYNISGNDDINTLASSSYFNSIFFQGPGNGGNSVGLILGNLENEKLQWETNYKASLGLDVSLLNDRITFSVDLYKNKIKDLLTLKSLPEHAGLENYWTNGGEMENVGYEFSLNIRPVDLKNFKWELGATVGHYKNKVTALPDGNYITDIYGAEILTSVGNPLGVFYGYRTDGVLSTRAEAESAGLKVKNTNGTYTDFRAGDMRFVNLVDVEGEPIGIIGEEDKTIIGDPNPDIYGSIISRFIYKRLTLDVLFAYSYGNDVYNYLRSKLESGSNTDNQSTTMLNRWTGEGQQTNVPKATYGDPMGNSRFSDRWIEDGSYIRLKNLKLSYKLPFKSNYISAITLWGAADNLFTITKYLGGDPEFSCNYLPIYQGIDLGLTPLSRSYYFGIKLDL